MSKIFLLEEKNCDRILCIYKINIIFICFLF